MKIVMACPAPPGSRVGNRVTALRWAGILKGLGHRVRISAAYAGEPCDLLIALHARRSHEAVVDFRQRRPRGPLIVALTGTDLYRDIHRSARARRSLELADRLVLLQPRGRDALPTLLRPRARVIYQSAQPTPRPPARSGRFFDVCVLGHLRAVKDPFRAALALRYLPATSRIRILQVGSALNQDMARRARALEACWPRYHWLGEKARWQARRILAGSRLLVLSSRMEGGANAIAEAVVDQVPVVASRISGSIGMLGARYPGFFPFGDTRALARLLRRAEEEHRDLKFISAVQPGRSTRSAA